MIHSCSYPWHVPAARYYVTAAFSDGSGRVACGVRSRPAGTALQKQAREAGAGLVVMGECRPLVRVWGPLWWADSPADLLATIAAVVADA